ncbi:class I SAM-dependent methyltransferase [Clostridium sp. Marseille-P2415]|uniref:class I SAM-dependent methyltransferase n=1 Tax=Clostridium sp. Marseille-P2415 TaxID=1805471 RepID=UPI0009888124|nr:class I SAM-dependent methyltransferase [Clostridium sp. Marseille-P2415]
MMNQEQSITSVEELHKKAAENSRNYEIYFRMGEYYKKSGNLKRAYLCYAHSSFLCDKEEDAKLISDVLTAFTKEYAKDIPKAAFIIPSVPSQEQMEIILSTCLAAQEDCQTVVVIDREESEEVTNWLKGQKDISYVSGKGLSPALAYRKAAKLTKKNEDILFLGQGSVLLNHALFQLRMSLYKTNDIGAVNAVTNGPALGLVDLKTPIDRANVYAAEHNLPGDEHMDPVLIPSCLTILVQRDSWAAVKGFDEHFSTQEVLEKDLSFQLLHKKKLTYLCHHAYVYTFGQQQSNQARLADYDYFHQKWNVRLNYSLFSRPDILALVTDPKETPLRALDVGCACGASLLSMKNKYPSAELHGIELDPGSWKISSLLFPVTQGNVEENLDYPEGFFDYIIFGDVLEHLHQPESVLVNMKRYLKPGGAILASIPNVMHISVISDLLNGFWTYQESGILDRTHLRFFTKTEITRMFSRAGYEIEDMGVTRVWISPEQQKMIDQLCSFTKSQPDAFTTYQYLVKARKK